jgi:Fe-S oxidoreductase
LLGFSARRSLPRWRRDRFRDGERGRQEDQRKAGIEATQPVAEGREVVLFADTFNRYFEPENLRAAVAVLQRAGCRVHFAAPRDGGRPLCCGRTFLAQGLVEEARFEMHRLLDALRPFLDRGLPVLGLEPSCLFTLRDELPALLPDKNGDVARQSFMWEEFLEREVQAGALALPLKALPQRRALLHGHCHQKAFDALTPVERLLRRIPELQVEALSGSCCGMAGSFGYEAEHYEVSMRMAEASLLPQVRSAAADALLVADGTSCRHQIRDGAGREAVHVARVLAAAMD